MPTPTPLAFAFLKGVTITPSLAGDILFALAALTTSVVLLRQWGWRDTPLRSVYLLVAGFSAAVAVGFGFPLLLGETGGGAARLAAAGVAWLTLLALIRYLGPATAEREAQDRDLARLQLLEAAVIASGDGVVIAEAGEGPGAGLRIVYANPAFERMTGYLADEVVGFSPSVLADEVSPESLLAIREIMGGTNPSRVELPGRRKDGSRVWAEWQVVPVATERGQHTHSVAVLRDTTQRRLAELVLRESEARSRCLFEQAADAMFLVGADGFILDANHRACQTLGYTLDELKALRLTDLGAGTRITHLDPGETLTAENWYKRKDGTTYPVEVRCAVLEAGGQRLKLAMVRDLTRRRLTEQALREREELLRNIISNIPCAVFWKDRNSMYLGCNDQVARDHGVPSVQEVIGRTDYDIGKNREESAFYRECDQRVMESGQPINNLEEAQTRPDGSRATLLTSKVPLRDASGAVVGVLGVYQDITDRKRLEEQLRQAQKMDAIGRLAGGIAHDFNNLLTVIQGTAELLQTPEQGHPEPSELLDDLRLAADRAAALVRQLLMFSRRQPTRPEVMDLNAVVSGLACLLRRLLGERVIVETRLATGFVPVRADRSHLEQVVVNLAVNARDAMPDGGTLTLSTEVVTEPGADPDDPRRFARLSVSDTGVGMSEEVQAHIFEPFFTTKGPDKGTGLGLATVFGIVEQAGGQIRVESTAGVGTTFRLDLPWCAGSPSTLTMTPLPVSLPEHAPGRPRTLLLVEDEDAVRKFARVSLESGGYSVTDAPGGEVALAMAGSTTPMIAPDALVTDLTMPGIDGYQLARRLRAVYPNLGVVFMSGYVPETARIKEISGAIYVPKPFTPSELLRAVTDVLPRPGSIEWALRPDPKRLVAVTEECTPTPS